VTAVPAAQVSAVLAWAARLAAERGAGGWSPEDTGAAREAAGITTLED
jgi:hypothetical protein